MSTAIAKNLMAEMKLLVMFGAFDNIIASATRDQISYTEFLDTLLQAEADYRQERKTGYRIKAAKFTLRPAFEDIDFTASRSISKAQIKELYSLQWLSEGRPVLLIGQTGVGKTFIAQAAGLHACACGKSVLYMTVTTWLENLALARSSGTYLRYRDKLARPDLLILDDMGTRKLSSTEAQDLCEILEERSIGRSTMFTTQLPLLTGRRSLPIPSSAMRSVTASSTPRSRSTSPGKAIAASRPENLPARNTARKNRPLLLRQ